MKITKEEENIIVLHRLVKKASIKFEENYFSINLSGNKGHYYLPSISHNNFESIPEAIKGIRKILKKTLFEYKYDIAKLDEIILSTKKELRENKNKLNDALKLKKSFIMFRN